MRPAGIASPDIKQQVALQNLVLKMQNMPQLLLFKKCVNSTEPPSLSEVSHLDNSPKEP